MHLLHIYIYTLLSEKINPKMWHQSRRDILIWGFTQLLTQYQLPMVLFKLQSTHQCQRECAQDVVASEEVWGERCPRPLQTEVGVCCEFATRHTCTQTDPGPERQHTTLSCTQTDPDPEREHVTSVPRQTQILKGNMPHLHSDRPKFWKRTNYTCTLKDPDPEREHSTPAPRQTQILKENTQHVLSCQPCRLPMLLCHYIFFCIELLWERVLYKCKSSLSKIKINKEALHPVVMQVTFKNWIHKHVVHEQ